MNSDGVTEMGRRRVLQALGSLGLAAGSGITAARTGRRPGPRPEEILVGVGDDIEVEGAVEMMKQRLPVGNGGIHANDTLGYVAVEVTDEMVRRAREVAAATIRDNEGGQVPDGVREAAKQLRQAPAGRRRHRARELIRRAIEMRPEVDYVERNETYETQLVPNDPLFDEQYAPQLVDADDAWDTTFGSTDVTVAVVDTGIEYDHPDLAPLFADDPGRDFADDGDPDIDARDESHGTHVAGCASADTDNTVGVAGPTDSTLLAARALDESGQGSLTDVADSIQWATDQGADVINLSLGGGYTETLKRAVEYAYDQNDVLVVCAAGNEGQSRVDYPARYEECVAVSALDPNENFASFSNYGPNVEVAAPGVNVLSTVPPEEYAQLSGTSMAAPVATGVAALGKAANPNLSGPQLRQLLRETAEDVGLPENRQGAGRVDAANIVADAEAPDNEVPTASAAVSPSDPTVGETVTFDASGSSDPDGSIASYEWKFGDGTTATGVTVEHAYDSAGEYSASLTVTDDEGATDVDAVVLTVGRADGCNETASGSATSSLAGWWDRDRWEWTQRFESTCELTVSLTGPERADFDLYVTADGRTPTRTDFDGRSVESGSEESVTLSDIEGSVGILVDSYRGRGQYTLSIEETGSGRASASDEQALTSVDDSAPDFGDRPGRGKKRGQSDEDDDDDDHPGRGRGRDGDGDDDHPGRGRGRGGNDDEEDDDDDDDRRGRGRRGIPGFGRGRIRSR